MPYASTSHQPTLEQMLRDSLWAAALTPPELDQVVRESFERRVPAGGHAMRAGERAECWYGILEGVVKMSVSEADGRVSTFTGVFARSFTCATTLRGSSCARLRSATLIPSSTAATVMSSDCDAGRPTLGVSSTAGRRRPAPVPPAPRPPAGR